MAYNEKTVDRIREIVSLTHENMEEKKMFSGLCFMGNAKMCVGVRSHKIMIRLDPAIFDKVIEKEDCEPINFTGEVMQGFIFVDKEAITTKRN